jgi:hypothetical protein
MSHSIAKPGACQFDLGGGPGNNMSLVDGVIDPRLKLSPTASQPVSRIQFRVKLNNVNNVFEVYRREVIDGCRPFLSPHFTLTIAFPLKAIVRGFTWMVIPITCHNRRIRRDYKKKGG